MLVLRLSLWRLRLFSFGGYGLALAALALVVFGAYDSYPHCSLSFFQTLMGKLAVGGSGGANPRPLSGISITAAMWLCILRDRQSNLEEVCPSFAALLLQRYFDIR